jgi:hypothetical protein
LPPPHHRRDSGKVTEPRTAFPSMKGQTRRRRGLESRYVAYWARREEGRKGSKGGRRSGRQRGEREANGDGLLLCARFSRQKEKKQGEGEGKKPRGREDVGCRGGGREDLSFPRLETRVSTTKGHEPRREEGSTLTVDLQWSNVLRSRYRRAKPTDERV